MKPLLSICIPTYNRAHYLKECLDSIVCQFDDENVKDNVEIVVSDNASEDNTQQLLKEYQKKFNNIRYFKNKENLGFDKNVDNVLTLATGKFCWTLSDEEILEKDSLSTVLEIIRSHPEISYIGISRRNKASQEIQYFKNGNECIQKGLPPGGYLSFNIFNKKFLPADRKKYYGNYWFHYSCVLEIIANKPFIVVKNNFIKEVEHKPRLEMGGANFFIYTFLKQIIQDLPQFGYEKKSINKLLNGFARGAPRNIASARIHGLKISIKNLSRILIVYYRTPFWLLSSIILFFTPTFFLRQLKKLFKICNLIK
jgi:glycosyltransferase involved in cell wall biosynthesis